MDFIKKNKVWIALAIIIVFGVFLRTYKFSDWLQFSPDQARDLTLIENTLSGKISFPLLGPQAGNTNLNMGPMYYHWQYLSALIFGATPESMAYPDLFFSILAIPLLFLLANKFFAKKISLAIVALFAISFFSIINSRFASNPNSIPFFVILFLYSVLELASVKDNKKILWAAIAGASVGVGIQLHALLIFILPAVLGIAGLYFLWKKIINWKSIVIIIIFFILLNTGQIAGELSSGWTNTNSLISGITSKSKEGSLLKNINLVFACQIQANTHMLFPVDNLEECGAIYKIGKQISKAESPGRTLKVVSLIIRFIFIFVFSLGGYFLLGYFLKKEKNAEKKRFLQLMALYSVVSVIVLIPVVTEISVRYFIILIFVPFILVGLWINFLLEKVKKAGIIMAGVFFIILSGLNATEILNATGRYQKGTASDAENCILGEVKEMSNYVLINSGDASKFNLVGKKSYVHRFGKPIAYLTKKSVKKINKRKSDKNLSQSYATFYIDKASEKENRTEIKGYRIKGTKKFGNMQIYLIEI
jgi:hypothetical protein